MERVGRATWTVGPRGSGDRVGRRTSSISQSKEWITLITLCDTRDCERSFAPLRMTSSKIAILQHSSLLPTSALAQYKKNRRGVFRGDFLESKTSLRHSERFQRRLVDEA